MSEILEAIMVVAFGCSWPLNIATSLRTRTAKGKSILFMALIEFGYVCGIGSKLASGKITYVFVFYVLNFVMVAIDIVLYFRNRRYDRLADEAAKSAAKK